jgi:iron complex transport system substrate-binding protein
VASRAPVSPHSLRASSFADRMPVVRQILVAFAMLLAVAACRGDARVRASGQPALADDFGDTLRVLAPARRIVSLSPATTEMLFVLGAGGRLVGRSHYDAWPDSARLVPDLGDGIRPSVESVIAARPDLVVIYASADNRAAAVALHRAGISTLALRADRIAELRRALHLLGLAAGDTARATRVADSVEATLARVRRATAGLRRPAVFWHVWDAPLITIGRGSYLSDLVEIAGGRNIYDSVSAPSPQISFEDLVRRSPEIVLAGPEGARTILASPAWRALAAVREGRVLIVDTALVGRPSVRLGEAAVSLARLLHPELGGNW